MINDRPPRDAPPTGVQNTSGDDTTHGIRPTDQDKDSTGPGDFPGEELPQPYSPTLRQGYPLFMNTSGLDPSSSSKEETAANTAQSSGVSDPFPVHRGGSMTHGDDLPQRSAFHDPFRTFHDHHALQARGPSEAWDDPTTQLPMTTPIILPHDALHIYHPDGLVRHDDALFILYPADFRRAYTIHMLCNTWIT